MSEKVKVEEALERAVERVAEKKMAEKGMVEAAESLQIKQIQVSLFFFASDFIRN